MTGASSHFWRLVTAARKTLGLSERALADLAGLKEGRLFDQRTSAGRRSGQPTPDVVEALHRGFKRAGLNLPHGDLLALAYGQGDYQGEALGRLVAFVGKRHERRPLSRGRRRGLRRASPSKDAA